MAQHKALLHAALSRLPECPDMQTYVKCHTLIEELQQEQKHKWQQQHL
jgi:hypothetical protein